MNIYAAASLFAILILLYWIISEVFTVLFRFIGLPEEKARFQVISLLTSSGFTTRESEMFLSTRSRRRLARITMLFGYVFNITIVSAFVNVFVSMKLTDSGSFVLSMLIPIAALTAVLLLARYRKVRAWVDRQIERVANRYSGGRNLNGIVIVDQIGGQTIARVTLHKLPAALEGKSLMETNLRSAHNILVLTIEQQNGVIVSPTPKSMFRVGDQTTVFGKYQEICAVFEAKERFAER